MMLRVVLILLLLTSPALAQQKSASQVSLEIINAVTQLSNYIEQQNALIKQLQDENKALKEKNEGK
jgi:hypothetical protein